MRDFSAHSPAASTTWSAPPLDTSLRDRIGAWLVAASGWLIISALAFAPWALAGRPLPLRRALTAWLLIAVILWGLGLLLQVRSSGVRVGCVLAAAWLLLTGWLTFLNPESFYNASTQTFEPLAAFSALPTTIDRTNSLPFLLQITAMLGVIGIVADLGRDPRWRHRLIHMIAVVGCSVVAFGLLQRIGPGEFLRDWLKDQPWAHGSPFGPFDYHGNAGTFINLTIPAAVACGIRSWRRAGGSRLWMGWFLAAAFCYIALFVNTSRTALVIGLACFPIMTWWVAGTFRYEQTSPARNTPTRAVLAIALLGVLAAGVVISAGGSRSIQRMADLPGQLAQPWYPRYMQYKEAWRLAGERPFFGAGVGSHKLLLPHSRIAGHYFAPEYEPGQSFTVLSHVKQDYLQTMVEWGGIGFAAWAALVGGAFLTLGRSLRAVSNIRTRDGFLIAVALALTAVYLHALVDCPLQVPSLQLYAAAYLGLAWSSGSWANE